VRHARILVTHYGGPEALQVIEEECPQPHAGTGMDDLEAVFTTVL
jgi:hypothetical protein